MRKFQLGQNMNAARTQGWTICFVEVKIDVLKYSPLWIINLVADGACVAFSCHYYLNVWDDVRLFI